MMCSRDSVLSSFPLLDRVAAYCDARDVLNACCVSVLFHEVFSRDSLWEELCSAYGFRSLTPVTKTRGKRSFRSIYFSALCIECRVARVTGNVVIDTNGGSSTRFGGVDGPTNSLISMCIHCFKAVQLYSSLSERLRCALPNSKQRVPAHVRNAILQKIPFPEKKKEKKRCRSERELAVNISNNSHSHTYVAKKKDRFEDPHHNDYLIKQLGYGKCSQ